MINPVKDPIKFVNRDSEIQKMREIIHDKTGEWEGLLIFNGETVEEYRERLRKRVKEIKKINNEENG